MSLSINNVSKKYGVQKALDQVSFSIPKGEIVGFLGPNGAGKSTLMKITTGYLSKDSGEIEICGINIDKHPIKCKKLVGYLPEHNPLYLEMYVKEYLQFIADIYKIDHKKNKIQEVIELTGLMPEYSKKIGALSKGYRQRVGLAQVLLHNPEVLILDEPTTGLDPNQIDEVRKLILNIAENKTIILSTHIMQEVEAICNRAIIINHGKIVANTTNIQGKIETLFKENTLS